MKTSTFFSRYVALLFLLLFSSVKVYAQRNYATTQASSSASLLCLGCVVDNQSSAIDANLQTYSTINVPVGLLASTYQELIFPVKIAANTPLTIKIGTGDNLLDLTALGNITIRPYNGNSPVGGGVSAATLVSALSSNNQLQLSITPTQTYDKVRITLNGGLLSLLSSIYVYEAFYNGPANVACNNAYDELHGISSGLLNLGVNVGGVVNPQNAIDGNINTASTLNAGVAAVGAYAQQTIIYERLSVLGDSIRMTLSLPQAILDLGVLANISVVTYNGNTSNNDAIFFNSALINLRLLDLAAGRRRVTITYAPTKAFDRVQLRLGGGLASALSTLNLYEAEKLIPRPIIKFNNVVTNNANICAGSSVTLSATAVPNTTFNWYTAATGGSPVHTGPTYSPAVAGTTTYYVSAARAGCTDESERTAVTVTVNPIPVAPVITNNNISVCPGGTATFTAQPVSGVTINWYTAATGGTPIATGISFTTGAINATTPFYAEAITGGTCPSPTRTLVTATLSALPAVPTLTANNVTICDGDVAVLSIASPVAGQTYNWYSTSTGGTSLFTGVNFTSPVLHNNAVYFAAAVNATGCESATRVQANVTVSPKPADPVLVANNLTVSAGQTATINVTNTQTGVIYRWYTSANAATEVHTGSNYTTPQLYTNTTYYVAAFNAAGCESVNRTAITINVTINNNSPCTFANAQVQDVNGICIGCSIANNALATDADTTTASSLHVIAGLLGGYAQQTLQFQQPGFAGDTVKVVLNSPVNLADISVAGGVSLALYNGATLVGRYTLDNALIKVRLLGGGNRYAVYLRATAAYDRVEVRLTSGVATLLTALDIYYAVQQYPTPVFADGAPQICSGSPATLTVTTGANGTIKWYTVPVGGVSEHTGATYTTGNLTTTTTYYAEYSRGTCVSPTRYPITVTVNDPPAKPTVIPPSATITAGQTATFKATAATGAIIKWYETPAGGTAVFTGSTFTTPVLTSDKTYYAEAVLGSCPSPDRTVVPVTVTPVVVPNVTVVPPTQAVDPGTSATLTASSTTPGVTFNWYTSAVSTDIVYTGATFNTPPIFTPITYYAEAVVTATGVKSATRAPGAITLNAVTNNPVPCDAAISQTNTVGGGLLCALCGIANPNGSIDNNRNTFSQLNVPIGVLGGYAEQVLRFANTGRAGDSVVVELGIPGSLVSVGVLSQISLATYNGTTFNNDRTTVDGALIKITLLNGVSRFTVAFKANADFDRIEIRLNSGVAGVFNSLNIYDAAQEVAKPVIAVTPVTACAGTQATLIATVPAHVTVKWYTTAQGGSPVGTGATFNTPVLNATRTYYAEASRTADGCTQTIRTPVVVNVTPTPGAPVVNTPTVTVCSGQPATFTANAVPGVTFAWYTTQTGGTPVSTANPFVTGPLTATTIYFVEAQGAGACGSSTRTQVTANVTLTPLVPTVSQNPTQTCSGSSAVLTATSTQPGVIFNWYDNAAGGAPIFTGATFTTPQLTASRSYYVEAAAGTCVSPTRAKADVTVNPTPVAPVVTINPAGGQITSGQTATFTATSTTAGATFKWYTSPTGGTAIHTGNTFTTPALTSSTTYYVESVLAGTGCTSPTRTPVNITVNPIFSTSCDFANTQSFDVNGGVLCVGCTVVNPNNSVDADTTTFGRITLPVAIVGSYVSQMLIFSDGGLAGDSVTVKIGIPASLATVGVLNQLQIASYNGVTYNGDRINLSSSLIKLRILAGGQVGLIRFAPGAAFDRIEIRLNSAVAALFNTTDIYYASKQVDAPIVTASTVNICSGTKATFTISNPKAGVTYKWYSAAVGGTIEGSGTTFTTDVLNSTQNYFVEASRTSNGCANPNRVSVTANVTQSPVNPTLNITATTICAGDNVTLTVTNPGTSIVKWYSAATNGTLLFTGPSYTVSPVTTMSYFAELSNGACNSPARTQATVTVNPRPSKPGVASNNVLVCSGSPATLAVQTPEAGVIYNWYTVATGGAIELTGATVSTGPITQNTSYYVEAATAAGCTNNGGRTRVDVTVSGTVNAPTLSATTTQVCAGGSVTISVNNPIAGQQYNFYTAATNGTLVHTGTSFTINNVTADVSYFVEATNGTCTSATRTRTDITVTAPPTPPQVQAPAGGLVACDGSDITISIANPQPDLVYRWYTAAVGGTLLYTGTEFTTTITGTTTFFVEAASAGNCNPSTRTPVTVTVSPLPPDPTVESPAVAVCLGTSATLKVSSPQAGITYKWYDSPAQTTVLFTGTTYVTDPITATTNFYVAAFNTAGCSSSNLAQVQVTTRPAPAPPVIANGNPVQTCQGTTATLTVTDAQAGYTYKFYTVANGGTAAYTGASYVTPSLSANTTYYVEAINDNGCPSASRTMVVVTVNALPNAPQASATGTQICPNNATTLTATPPAGSTIKWYAAATGGTALASGNSFNTPVLSTNTTYYVEAVSTATGCASGTRTPVTVTILGPLAAPTVSVLTSTTSSVTFTYNAVPGAVGYQVSLDNGLTFSDPSSGAAGLTHTVTGLNPNQSVTIIVHAVGNVDCQLGANSTAVTGTAANPFGDGIFIPNAFTPNGDGNNDVLYVYGNTIQKLTFSVYDQWGELQFRTTNKAAGWDGTYKGHAQPVGVYVYYVEVTLDSGQVVKKKGTATLIR
jgi:gliding motility-associated-like protein